KELRGSSRSSTSPENSSVSIRQPRPHRPLQTRLPEVDSKASRGAGLDVVISALPATVCALTRPETSRTTRFPFTVDISALPEGSTVTVPETACSSTSPKAPRSVMLPFSVWTWTSLPVGSVTLSGPRQEVTSSSASTSSPECSNLTVPGAQPGPDSVTWPVDWALSSMSPCWVSRWNDTGPPTCSTAVPSRCGPTGWPCSMRAGGGTAGTGGTGTTRTSSSSLSLSLSESLASSSSLLLQSLLLLLPAERRACSRARRACSTACRACSRAKRAASRA